MFVVRATVVLAAGVLAVRGPSITVTAAQAPASNNLVVTVIDPLGAPAANVPLLLENGPFQIPFVAQGRTDSTGRYRVRVPAGTYQLSAPVEFFPSTEIAVPLRQVVQQTVRMRIDATTATFAVCLNCPETQPPPTSIVEEFRADREAQLTELVSGAEPDVGWEFYQPQAPDALRRLGAAAPTGTVVLEGRIAADGRIRDLRVVSAADPGLASAATSSMEETRWRPARIRGRAVEVPLRVTFEYIRQ